MLRTVICVVGAALAMMSSGGEQDKLWVTYNGTDGPGKGKHIVFIAGDEEYRSEESLPQLAKILAKHHGFKCTVVFSIDPKTGFISPNTRDNTPGLDALKTADLMVIFTRFRSLPDDQMQLVVDYVESGKPVIGLRTATHAFAMGPKSKFARYSHDSKQWDGGFGRQVLGETWITHHVPNRKGATRGLIASGQEDHPILRGIKDGDIFGASGIYGVRLPMLETCKPLVLGQALTGMMPSDPPSKAKYNDPMMPVAWTNSFKAPGGQVARVFTTTMGASEDLLSEGTRRMLVNAAYWALGMENQIPPRSNADIVGDFTATKYSFNGYVKEVRPASLSKF
jgi:hypothetical protein